MRVLLTGATGKHMLDEPIAGSIAPVSWPNAQSAGTGAR
jgi:hypothetical protein